MNEIPGDPNYPAGVSARDIDERFGSPDHRCPECGVRIEEEYEICDDCKQKLDNQ